MKHFRTDVSFTKSLFQISHKTAVLTVGSCFSEAIGARLKRYKFETLTNPFGVIYNPVSIHRVLQYALLRATPLPETYLEVDGLHRNYDFHSRFTASSRADLENSIQEAISDTNVFLQRGGYIMITYGTAWVYSNRESRQVVANCHKVPASAFEKTLLKAEQVVESFSVFYKALKQINPAIRIILTLSPVRHLKDTLELNSVGKAVLRVACHELTNRFQDVEYFPAFEIMMDDLRDYRFYKSDMLHPTEDAEDYIWEKFSHRYFTADTLAFISRWDSILAAVHHRPFQPDSASHQKFLRDTLSRLQEASKLVDVEEELALVKKQVSG